MKKLLLLAVLGIVLSANKCSDGGTTDETTTQMTNIDGKKWVLQSIGGTPVELPDGVEAWIQLNTSESSLQGFGGCNQLFGSYKAESETVAFENIGSTKKYCESTSAVESQLITALRAANGYKMKKGVLSLLQGAKEVAFFKAAS